MCVVGLSACCWCLCTCLSQFALQRDTALYTACSKSEFLEAYKSCWMRWRAQDRNDWREREGGRDAAQHHGRGVSSSHLQAWLNNRMLYENKNIICLLKSRERPSNCPPPPSLRVDARLSELATKKSGSAPFAASSGLSSHPCCITGMYQRYGDYKEGGVLFNSEEDYSWAELLIEFSVDNEEMVAPLWLRVASHVANFTAGVSKIPLVCAGRCEENVSGRVESVCVSLPDQKTMSLLFLFTLSQLPLQSMTFS